MGFNTMLKLGLNTPKLRLSYKVRCSGGLWIPLDDQGKSGLKSCPNGHSNPIKSAWAYSSCRLNSKIRTLVRYQSEPLAWFSHHMTESRSFNPSLPSKCGVDNEIWWAVNCRPTQGQLTMLGGTRRPCSQGLRFTRRFH